MVHLATLAALPLDAQATRQSTITGRVTDAVSGAPVEAAQIRVLGTTLGAVADGEGRYTIRGVPAGTVEVRALRVGYAEQKRAITVEAGATTTADFTMRPVSIQLAPVVTTATGQERRVEVGNDIVELKASEIVREAPVSNVGDLLVAKAPGVQVLPGATTGAGSRVRIRGTSSLSLSNEPIYVIDGVRMESSVNSASRATGGTIPARTGDLNPDEIEAIEIVKGPSAATLYGTDAANGVIVIRTKRGIAGPAVWSAYMEQGAIADRNPWPLNWTSYGSTPAGADVVNCFNHFVASGDCTRDSTLTYTPARDPETRPFTTGYRQQYGLQVQGGSERVRYFASGEWEDEVGIAKMPDVDRQWFGARGIPVLDRWKRPNDYWRGSARSNVELTLSPKADASLSAGYTNSKLNLPQMDNNITGWTAGVLGGQGRKYPATTNSPDTLYGFYAYRPGEQFQDEWSQSIDRFIGSANTNWRPLTWLALRGNFGLDYTSRVETDLCRFETCANFSTYREGFKIDNRSHFHQWTADVSGTANFQIIPTLASKSTVGVQYFRNLFDRNGTNSAKLPPGATSVTAGSVPNGAPTTTFGEVTDDSRTLGAFVEQSLAWRDRLFLTGALRADQNSAFGQDFRTALYPKVSASWVTSDEAFFPQMTWLNQLRLRAAYGASGRQPNPTDALQYYDVAPVRLGGAEFPGVVFRAIGNKELKPERSAEVEAGFDVAALGNRLNFQFTYYDKISRDALISRVLPPSSGAGTTDLNSVRFENLGKVRNAGAEAQLSAQVVDREPIAWDFTISASHNENKLVDLGDVPPIIGTTIRQIEGYPMNGYWQRPIVGWDDADEDGVLSASEIDVGATPVFMGYSIPKTEVSVTNGFDFLNRRLRVRALVDYKGGHKLYNNTERIRCQSFGNCRGLNDPRASLEDQAAAVAAAGLTTPTFAGFIEDAEFVRLREISLTVTPPDRFAGYLRARRLSATIAARNLAVWTKYKGLDPEANYGQNDVPTDFLGVAPPTYLTFRLNVGF
ncbi:MAG: SusC/RagA family TonB-linked outer membrane protein [Gemmatimonadota bacterium]|nr:SusC/RagA family TonB-linked outer membrane protein [Gemmatimonadota bacterium]